MSEPSAGLTTRAAELRHAFDRAFAEPIGAEATAKENLLVIRIAGQAHAIRLSEIAGLFVDKKITPVPGGSSTLLGIAGFRGAIVPVYDLHLLLGHSGCRTPRWLVIAAAEPVAFAFETFERQRRLSRDAIVPRSQRPETRKYISEYARARNFDGPIVDLPSILEAIEA